MGKTHIPCKLTKCLQSIYQPFRVKLKKREGHLAGAGRGFDFTSLFSAFFYGLNPAVETTGQMLRTRGTLEGPCWLHLPQ